jgi:cytoskeleton-associated protein 5
VLKARVTDTNKAVQTLALDIVSRIATGMGKAFEKQTRFFALPVATVLADQKAPIRAAAVQTLTAIATACDGLESMVHGLNTALEASNPVQKSTLMQWLASWFKDHPPPSSLDLNSWAGPIVASLDDRNSDVRKGAQGLLPTLITCAGFDYVMQQTNSLKPASRASAVPIIQAARPVAQAALPPQPTKAVSKPTATNTPTRTETPPPPSPTADAKPAATTKLTGIRRKLPQGPPTGEPRAETPVESVSRMPPKPGTMGLKRPGGASQPSTEPPSPLPVAFSSIPFSSTSMDAKKARLGKDAQRWINEAGPTRKDLAEVLQHQMEPHASKELVSLLFSHDHNAVNDHIAGLTMMCGFFSSLESADSAYGLSSADVTNVCLANFDLPLKYASIKAHEPQTNMNSKCLDLVEAVLGFLRNVNCQLNDTEALCFIPTMIYKVKPGGFRVILDG